MNLRGFLAKKKAAVLNKWYDLVLQTYPPETARFLKEEKDRFANPVGHVIYEGIEGLYEELLHGVQAEKAYHFLDRIIRIRAVQDFSPSRAVAFLFLLKQVVREEVAAEFQEGGLPWEELLQFESQIDDLAGLAFDMYMQCREQLFEIRVKEIKNRTSRLLQRANLEVDFLE
ncbi:RsbRD N-terminal domain-containing protein [Moorellaceae bacterium AZ2]